jgi:predicted RNase H-like nuclease
MDPGVTDPKVTARGTMQRLAALRTVMDVEEALMEAPRLVPMVDALDACAAAWSAQRLAEGRGESVGDGAVDSRGRPMHICW